MNSKIRKTVLDALQNVLPFAPDSNIDATIPLQELGLDSITFVQLIVIIEDSFGIEFPTEKLSLRVLTTLTDICDQVEALI